jgi:hypothetical protein
MSLRMINLIVLIVPPVLFAFIAAVLRPGWKVAGLALAAGLFTGGVNLAGDALAHHFGWWRFPFTTGSTAPLIYYLAAGLFYGAGMAGLVGRWVRLRFGWKGASIFLAVFPFFGLGRDFGSTGYFQFAAAMIAWGPGFLPVLMDFLLWGLAISAGFFALVLLERAAQQ